MKRKTHKRIPGYVICMSVVATLAACGGGNASSTTATSTPSTPATSSQLIGKAIDGYLVGATVCFDNGQGACDASLPSGTTDATGGYSLPDSGNLQGKTLLVTVTPGTKDLSHPDYAFPATFTMSQTVTASGQQNISPLTTMISAQMASGLSQAQATAAVARFLGGNVDPNADYIAAGNSSTASTAAAILDKLVSFASNGVVDAATVRNTMNAIVQKGDVGSVTLADVQAQAARPVYASADASAVLANPTYALDSYLFSFDDGFDPGDGDKVVAQDVRQLTGDGLSSRQQGFVNGGWSDLTGTKFDTMYGAYELKSDASWSGFNPVAQYKAALPVSRAGTVISGIDPNNRIGYTLEYRSADLSGQPLSSAVPFNYGWISLWSQPALTGATFSAGTKAYAGLLSYADDRVVIPVWKPACPNPVIAGGMVCDGGQPALMEDGVISEITGDPAVSYTSVSQVIGLSLQGRSGGFDMTLTADGKVQYVTSNGDSSGNAQTVTHVVGTWTPYSRNSNVLVLDVDANTLNTEFADAVLTPLLKGAKLVVALRHGHLRLGWLFPSTYADKTVQFPGALNVQLLTAVNAAVAASGQ